MKKAAEIIAFICVAALGIMFTILVCFKFYYTIMHIDEPSDLDKQWQIIHQQEKELREQFKRSDK